MKTEEPKPKKKGFLALLKESMAKTSEGCGPGCGCHVEPPAKEPATEVAGKSKGDATK